MLQRTQNAAFLGGAYVFPGGSLDASDAAPRRVLGLTEAQANQRLGLSSGGLAYYVAAVRECFEEAGMLLACDANGNPVLPARAQQLMEERASPFLELLEQRESVHSRRRARLLRPLDHRARAQRGASTRASSSPLAPARAGRLARRWRNRAPPLDPAATRRSRAATRGEIELVPRHAPDARGLRALRRAAQRLRIRHDACTRSTPTAPAGRREGGREVLPPRRPAVLRDPLERSRGDRADELRPRPRRRRSGSTALSRGSSRPIPG